jgi:hypothetical protein
MLASAQTRKATGAASNRGADQDELRAGNVIANCARLTETTAMSLSNPVGRP